MVKLYAETDRNEFYDVLEGSAEAQKEYKLLYNLFINTSLTEEEWTVLWQTINVEHECSFCVKAHTAMAKHMKNDETVSNALRDETLLPRVKREALRAVTLEVVRTRVYAPKNAFADFRNVGFIKNIIELVLGLSQKVMINYLNHLAETPLEEKYSQFAWTKANRP